MSLPSTNRTYSPKEIQAMEAPLIALAQASGGDLRKLFYAFFEFLNKRTDFYLVPNEIDRKEGRASVGFPEGDAEKLLLSSFRQFPLRRMPRQQPKQSQAKQPQPQPTKEKAGTEESKSSTGATTSTSATATTSTTTTPQTKATTSTTSGSDESKEKKNDKGTKKEDNEDVVRYTESGLQIPIGNGGSTERYKWTQTIEECTVMLPVTEGTRAKQLSVEIKASSISVKEKQGADPKLYLEGSLTEKIQPDESTWSLESDVLIIILYKQKKTFWETVIVGDDKIDTSQVDSRRNIRSYDESTQAMIRRIIFDQNQKKLGKPPSHEIMGKEAGLDLPNLPPGVEYYDQSTIEKIKKEQKKK